jgi:hypothetical protein
MPYLPLLLFLFLFASCAQPNNTERQNNTVMSSDSTTHNDSLEITKLLKRLYQWHDSTQNKYPDFLFIQKDTLLVQVNRTSFNHTLLALKNTNLFSAQFLNHYSALADTLDYHLTHGTPKSTQQINFPFQDMDSWNGFQENMGDFWNHLSIGNYQSDGNNASFLWWLTDADTHLPISQKYSASFEKEAGSWKISSLSGFNSKNFTDY